MWLHGQHGGGYLGRPNSTGRRGVYRGGDEGGGSLEGRVTVNLRGSCHAMPISRSPRILPLAAALLPIKGEDQNVIVPSTSSYGGTGRTTGVPRERGEKGSVCTISIRAYPVAFLPNAGINGLRERTRSSERYKRRELSCCCRRFVWTKKEWNGPGTRFAALDRSASGACTRLITICNSIGVTATAKTHV